MKKILLIILLFTASTFLYSQSMDLNHKKIHIVDSTMGLGITPTSRLHVFGNGTTSNLFNVTNDKDAMKDSSIVVTSNGSFCSGTNTPAPLTKNTFVIKDDANIGITNTLWIDSTTIDSNKLHINVMKSLNTFNPVKGIFGIGGATYGNIYDAEFANSFFISSYSGDLHLANEMYPKMTIATNGVGIGTPSPNAALHVKDRWSGDPALTFIAGNDIDQVYDSSTVIDYFGKVGIGQTTPNYKLDIFGNGGATNLLKVSNDINSTYDSTFVIQSNGYVGIGTTTPKDYLDINGNITFPNNKYIFWNAYNKGGTIYQRNMSSNGVLMYQKTGDASKLFNIDIAGADDAGNDIPILGQKGALSIGTDAEIHIHEEIMWRDSLGDYKTGTTLSDNEAYSFPTNISWKGEIDVDSLGYTLFTAQIRCDANGTPYLEGVSWKRWSSKTYVEVGSTDGYLNITDGGTGMVITNTLGYTIKATLRFRTKE